MIFLPPDDSGPESATPDRPEEVWMQLELLDKDLPRFLRSLGAYFAAGSVHCIFAAAPDDKLKDGKIILLFK